MSVIKFVESLYHTNIDQGCHRIDLYDYQKEELLNFEKNKRIKLDWSRQAGQSLIALAYVFYQASIWPGTNVLVKSNNVRNSIELIRKIVGFEADTSHPSISYHTQTSVTLNNRSIIATDENTIRGINGGKIDIAFLDQYDYMQKHTDLDDYLKCTRVIVNSYKDFPGFYESKVNWGKIPGREYAWATQMISTIGYERWLQEFDKR
jgi:hypothetical protein